MGVVCILISFECSHIFLSHKFVAFEPCYISFKSKVPSHTCEVELMTLVVFKIVCSTI
jgi:hypothetical protein